MRLGLQNGFGKNVVNFLIWVFFGKKHKFYFHGKIVNTGLKSVPGRYRSHYSFILKLLFIYLEVYIGVLEERLFEFSCFNKKTVLKIWKLQLKHPWWIFFLKLCLQVLLEFSKNLIRIAIL